jgi:hypothetical protein
MAVVINEFEVVPADTRPRDERAPAGAQPTPTRPKDPERDLDRMLRRRHARALRLLAV